MQVGLHIVSAIGAVQIIVSVRLWTANDSSRRSVDCDVFTSVTCTLRVRSYRAISNGRKCRQHRMFAVVLSRISIAQLHRAQFC